MSAEDTRNHAFSLGSDARLADRPLKANPYPSGTAGNGY